MKGEAKPLIKFLDGSDNRFIIPVYQRNYDWKQDNCKQLFDDLIKVIRDKRISHFFGSIVSASYDGHGSSEYLIIDGQQRITTTSLLLLAIVNLAKEGIFQFEKKDLEQKIWNTYLIDQYVNDNCNKVRLKHIKHDSEAFEKLLFATREDENSISNCEFSKVQENKQLILAQRYQIQALLQVNTPKNKIEVMQIDNAKMI